MKLPSNLQTEATRTASNKRNGHDGHRGSPLCCAMSLRTILMVPSSRPKLIQTTTPVSRERTLRLNLAARLLRPSGWLRPELRRPLSASETTPPWPRHGASDVLVRLSVALNQLDALPYRGVQLRGVADQHPNRPALVQQALHHQSADVSCGTSRLSSTITNDDNVHEHSTLRPGLGGPLPSSRAAADDPPALRQQDRRPTLTLNPLKDHP